MNPSPLRIPFILTLIALGMLYPLGLRAEEPSNPETYPNSIEPSQSTPARFDRPFTVTDWHVEGAVRTDLEWLKQYLGLAFPMTLNRDQLASLEAKILNTEAYSYVRLRLELASQGGGLYIINIALVEKWTTIPVVRFVVGGGTPLLVMGVYDIHTLGKLWTVGAETRRYGSAPWGGVVWAKAPRWLEGKHEIGFELWQDNRVRSIFNKKDEAVGEFDSRSAMFRSYFLMPLSTPSANSNHKVWQAGFDFKVRAQDPTIFKPDTKSTDANPPPVIDFPKTRTHSTLILGKVILDNINISELNMDGVRFLAAAGPLWDQGRRYNSVESELFYYLLFADTWNFAFHGMVGNTTSDSLQNLYFLGGFESIRGIPDGVVMGNQAAYANVELRKLQWNFPRLQIQGLVFVDCGTAAFNRDELKNQARTSAGIGWRFAVPQVHRLILRFDYAWSLNNPGIQGFAIGMNQFFQPYKPL